MGGFEIQRLVINCGVAALLCLLALGHNHSSPTGGGLAECGAPDANAGAVAPVAGDIALASGPETSPSVEVNYATDKQVAKPKQQPKQTSNSVAQYNVVKMAKRVCRGGKAEIHSIHEMLQVIRWVNRVELKCKSRYLSAIYELEPILLWPKERLCDESTFDFIMDYHFRFIQPFRHANRAPTQFEPLPRDLVKEQLHTDPRKYTVEFGNHGEVLLAPITVRHFFLRFALQASHQCKMDLIKNLERDQARVLLEDDLKMMEPFTEKLLGKNNTEGIDFDSALYIPKLDGVMKRESGERFEQAGKERHLRTNAQEHSPLVRTITACRGRFKPLYDKLFMPISRLSKLGYDYLGDSGWTQEERDFLKSDLVRQWLVIMHVCEIFKNTKIIRMDQPGAVLKKKKSLRDLLNAIDDEHERGAGERTDGESSDGEEGDKVKEDKTPDDGSQQDDGKPTEQEVEPEGNGDGKLSEASAEEAAQLESQDDLVKPVEYSLPERFQMDDQLMIDTERDLELELSRKPGSKNPFGFRGWLRKFKSTLKKALAKLDLERFAHYRRHSLWYAGFLNFISSLSNVASITVTIYSMIQG